jgi:protein subunit release factor B
MRLGSCEMATKNERTRPVLSVTLNDCTVQTFRAGGPGGQNQNKRSTGVRIIHGASGAIGESREHRTQLENKRAAFRRMTEHQKFKTWLNRKLYGHVELEREVSAQMARTQDFVTEVKRDGKWVVADGNEE